MAVAHQYITPEEYLELERASETKHEYYNGRMYAMAGASEEHNLISVNCTREISVQLKAGPCRVYSSDMRVKVDLSGLYTYPDIVIVCEKPQLEDQHFDTLLNPTVLIEVLSESTEAYDRGFKFQRYRGLDTLKEYVLISQTEVRVEHYVRDGAQWILKEFTDIADKLRLDSVDCEVALRDMYLKVDLPVDVPARGPQTSR